MNRRRFLRMTGAGLAAPFALGGACAPPAPAPAAQRVAGDPKWEELVAKARQEGTLSILGGGGIAEWAPLYDHFDRLFDIRVETSTGSSRETVDRVLAERAAGRYTIDLFQAGPDTLGARLIPNGVLIPLLPELILPEITDESRWFQNRLHWSRGDPERKYVMVHSATTGIYDMSNARLNMNRVTQAEYYSLTSMWDFLKPEWRGRIVARPPEAGGTPGDVWFHPNFGPEWLRRFYKEMDVTFIRDERVLVDQLAKGAFAAGLFLGSASGDLDTLATQGVPIRGLDGRFDDWKDPLSLSLGGPQNIINMIDRAVHPNAARLFVNWLLSKDGQTQKMKLLGARTTYTLREDVTDPEAIAAIPPTQRRTAGREYLIVEDTPGYDYIQGMASAQAIYDER